VRSSANLLIHGVPQPKAEDARCKQTPKRRKVHTYSGPEPSVEDIEAEFWRIVETPDDVYESLYGQVPAVPTSPKKSGPPLLCTLCDGKVSGHVDARLRAARQLTWQSAQAARSPASWVSPPARVHPPCAPALQDLDSGHHGSGFPLPPFRAALLREHLAGQVPSKPRQPGACRPWHDLCHAAARGSASTGRTLHAFLQPAGSLMQ
jgi:hypothetical protein